METSEPSEKHRCPAPACTEMVYGPPHRLCMEHVRVAYFGWRRKRSREELAEIAAIIEAVREAKGERGPEP